MAAARPTEGLRDVPADRAENLPRAKAALACAIAAANRAQEDLEAAVRPVDKLAYARAAATQREAVELRGEIARLRGEIARLRGAHAAEIDRWVEAGSDGKRPMPAEELVPLERALGAIAGAAREAESDFRPAIGTTSAPPNTSGTRSARVSRRYGPPRPRRPIRRLVNWSRRSRRRNRRKRGC